MEKQETIVESLMKKLSGKKGRVSSGALISEGSLEGSVTFNYIEHSGLALNAPTKWNNSKFADELLNEVNKVCKENKFGWEVREKFQELALHFYEEKTVQIAMIYKHFIVGIKNMQLDTDGSIRHVELIHKDGNVVDIRILKN